MDNLYEWHSNYQLKRVDLKMFICSVFNLLNNGSDYYDINGKFAGRIIALDGPMNTLQIISDHSLSSDNEDFITIRVFYNISATPVFYITICGDNIKVNFFENGHWANTIQRVSNKILEDYNVKD